MVDASLMRAYVRLMPGLARGSAFLLAAVTAALFVPSIASADITGTVTTPRGVPVVPGVSVDVRDANNNFVDFQSTDSAGTYTVKTSSLSGTTPPPYAVKVSTYDSCDTKSGNSSRDASASAPRRRCRGGRPDRPARVL